MKVVSEFKEFLKEYKVLALAIAFVMGAASTTMIKSLVDQIIMPLVTAFVPGGAWRTATFSWGPFVIGWGPFLAELINFLIIVLVVFLIVKKLIREESKEEGKKK